MGRLSNADLLELRRWNTPTIYNGWEQITRHDPSREGVNLEETHDFMPQMGPMVGYAITIQYRPSDRAYQRAHPDAWREYQRYVASIPGPKIVIGQDLDKPRCVGAPWGEVTSNFHRAFGCLGVIMDGAIRDVDEMTHAGFKALARRMAVGHAFSAPVKFGCEVQVFGQTIRPGQLVHADKHGFLAVPEEDEEKLLDAARFMDSNECQTLIPAGRFAPGKTPDQILADLGSAMDAFGKAAQEKFGQRGEW